LIDLFSKKVAGARRLVFVHLFQKVAGVWGEEPRVTAFSFRQAFSFAPAASKEKASNKWIERHGYN